MSSLLDSLLDAAASLVNFLAVRHALTPADAEHRFGHGKAEPLAGLAQAAFIAGSAVLLALEAIHRFGTPQPVSRGEIGIAVMVLAIVLTVALVFYQRRVIRMTGSVAIDADSLHYSGDLFLNGSVIVSIILSTWLNWQFVDPLFGLLIAVYILNSARLIVVASLDRLMDRELPEAERERIFSRFGRLNSRVVRQLKGVGLGLYIARAIITAHGGRIWVDPAPGGGAQFSFSLPRQYKAPLPVLFGRR